MLRMVAFGQPAWQESHLSASLANRSGALLEIQNRAESQSYNQFLRSLQPS